MLNSFDDIHFQLYIGFNFNINDKDDVSLNNNENFFSQEDSIFSFKYNNSFNDSLEKLNIELPVLNNVCNFKSEYKKVFNIEKKIINRKFCRTRTFIKKLLDLNLNSYEVNHLIKLIKTTWISGIYSLLNNYLNNLYNKNMFKAEDFIFEFIYIKTSLIKTDNAKDNLNMLNISVKDLLTGLIVNDDKLREINLGRIKNNINLITFLHNILKSEICKDKESIKIVKKILFILEKRISYFVEIIWKNPEKCSKVENEFKIFCNKNKFIKKFKKSKEIVKIVKNIIKSSYPKEYEIITKEPENSLTDIKSNEFHLLNKLEENNTIKNCIEKIFEKLLEISKKEKFVSYFSHKKKS